MQTNEASEEELGLRTRDEGLPEGSESAIDPPLAIGDEDISAPTAGAVEAPSSGGHETQTSDSAGAPGKAASFSGPPVLGDPGSTPGMDVLLLSDPWGRADTVLDGGRIGALDVRAASVRGKSHRFASTGDLARTRQDEYCLAATNNGEWLVVVVADGVSGTQKGNVAATVAARLGCQIITGLLDGGVGIDGVPWDSEVVPRLAAAILREASKIRGDGPLGPEEVSEERLRTLGDVTATTAMALVVATHATDHKHTYVAANLAGDSALWSLKPSGWIPELGEKELNAEIASSAVIPLPLVGANPTTQLKSGACSVDEALVLMTDGLGDPLGDGHGDVGTYLAQQWQHPPDIHEFGTQLDFFARGFVDDRTAVVVWPRSTE